jgi:hypothetical protein
MGRTFKEDYYETGKEDRRPLRRRGRGPKTVDILHKHVKKRGAQRFLITLSDTEIEQIGHDIRHRKATFVARQSSNVTLWYVEVRGKPYAVAYDKKRGTIRTIMPPEYIGTTKEQR